MRHAGSPFSCPRRKFSKVTVIECTDCLSAGDALRQLDRRNIVCLTNHEDALGIDGGTQAMSRKFAIFEASDA